MALDILTQCQLANEHLHIHPLDDGAFSKYGLVHKLAPTLEFNAFLEAQPIGSHIGDETYIPSCPELQSLELSKIITENLYGTVDCQIGWYTGKANKLNAIEYHKCAEILYLTTPAVLLLGHVSDIVANTYHTDKLEAFFVPANTWVELYSSTVHFAPLAVLASGVRQIVVQQKHTNTPKSVILSEHLEEEPLLLERNKWVIAHKEAKALVEAGAYVGLIGQNLQLNQISL